MFAGIAGNQPSPQGLLAFRTIAFFFLSKANNICGKLEVGRNSSEENYVKLPDSILNLSYKLK